ncbi:unnamed protein product [Vicia faba]|uniref:monodehydroascorbate reductase (NADH) n=1 Tax=Vicia faba TaxID=3906 RepID=A0AAV0ZW37_VICFA|nr:unnamed protein product [Vicia faba]
MGYSFQYIILGGGVAAGYAAMELEKLGLRQGLLGIIYKEENIIPYDRPCLSKDCLNPNLPAGGIVVPSTSRTYAHVSVGDWELKNLPSNWYSKKGIMLYPGTEILRANLRRKLLSSEKLVFHYETLIIATGSTAIRLADFGVEGDDAKNIFYLWNVDDANNLLDAMKEKKNGKAVVIGGGYVAMEITASLRLHNIDVTMVYSESWCMSQLFTCDIAAFYEGYYANKGINIIKETDVIGFSTNSAREVKEVKLKDGRVLEADIVVVSLGGKPQISLFKGQLEEEQGGIKTDSFFKTSVSDVYAVGDVATFPLKLYGEFRRFEHADHARKSAEHVAKVLHSCSCDLPWQFYGDNVAKKGNLVDKYDYLPHLNSCSFDLPWQFYGDNVAKKGNLVDKYDYLPHLNSCSFDLSWQFYGDNVGETVLFGDNNPGSSKPKFGTYWIKDGKVVGAFLEGGTPDENEAIAKVARLMPAVVDVNQLATEGLSFAIKVARPDDKVEDKISATPSTYKVIQDKISAAPSPSQIMKDKIFALSLEKTQDKSSPF